MDLDELVVADKKPMMCLAWDEKEVAGDIEDKALVRESCVDRIFVVVGAAVACVVDIGPKVKSYLSNKF